MEYGEMSENDSNASDSIIDHRSMNSRSYLEGFKEEAMKIEDKAILKNLDTKSIKTSSLVCKKWNDEISSSLVLMKRLKSIRL